MHLRKREMDGSFPAVNLPTHLMFRRVKFGCCTSKRFIVRTEWASHLLTRNERKLVVVWKTIPLHECQVDAKSRPRWNWNFCRMIFRAFTFNFSSFVGLGRPSSPQPTVGGPVAHTLSAKWSRPISDNELSGIAHTRWRMALNGRGGASNTELYTCT